MHHTLIKHMQEAGSPSTYILDQPAVQHLTHIDTAVLVDSPKQLTRSQQLVQLATSTTMLHWPYLY